MKGFKREKNIERILRTIQYNTILFFLFLFFFSFPLLFFHLTYPFFYLSSFFHFANGVSQPVLFSLPFNVFSASSSSIPAVYSPVSPSQPKTPCLSHSTSLSSFSTSVSASYESSPYLSSTAPFPSSSSIAPQNESKLDAVYLNSLLVDLASPLSISSDQPFPTPRLRSNGQFRESRSVRTKRRQQFLALFNTFHSATVCNFKPQPNNAFASKDQHPNLHLHRNSAANMSSTTQQTSSQPATTLVPSGENLGRLVQAAGIASPYQECIKEAIETRVKQGKPRPKLVGILATPSPPSVAYAEWTRKACEALGIDFEIWKTWDDSVEVKEDELPKGTAPDFDLEADVEDLIIAANCDDLVHGIMVYYPIFHGRQDTYLQQIVDPRKDVEGLHFSYCWNMYHNVRWVAPSQLGGAPGTTREVPEQLANQGSLNGEQVPPGMAKSILPCTPLAVVKCLESIGAYDKNLPYGDRLYGKTITVVNRSEVVGRPLAALLSNDGAKVYSVDIDSIQEFNKRVEQDSATDHQQGARARSAIVKEAHARNATSRLRPHHVVRSCSLSAEECIRASDVVIGGVPSASYKIPTEWIKPGAICVNFSSEKNFEKDVRTRASAYLPATGKTTIAMLQRNLLRLVEYRELAEQK